VQRQRQETHDEIEGAASELVRRSERVVERTLAEAEQQIEDRDRQQAEDSEAEAHVVAKLTADEEGDRMWLSGPEYREPNQKRPS
jgi:hypothetical protein